MKKSAVPPHVASEAAARGLGTFKNSYKGRYAGPMMLACCLPGTFGGVVSSVGRPLIFGIVWLLAFAVLCAYMALVSASRRLYLFDQGLVTCGGRPKERHMFTWSEVVHVRRKDVDIYMNGMYTGSTIHRCVLELGNGGRVRVESYLYGDVEKLVQEIEERVTAALFPEKISALRSGDDVDFGALVVGAQGVRSKKRSMAWSQIRDMKLRRGRLRIYALGRRRAAIVARVGKITEFRICYSVLAEIVAKK